MKTVNIFARTITERTGYSKFPYKETMQVSIFHDGLEWKNHDESIGNRRLRIPFKVVFSTRRKKEAEEYIKSLGRSDSEKFIKQMLGRIIEDERNSKRSRSE